MSRTSTKRQVDAERPGSRYEEFVETAARLFQERGFSSTSVADIAKAGGLPIGSLYYYFPGGKDELAIAAIKHAATHFAGVLNQGLQSSSDPGDCLAACALLIGERSETADWTDGCPVAAIALDTIYRSDEIQAAADDAVGSWVSLVTDRLIELDVPDNVADEVAVMTITLLEGAELVGRLRRSRQPFDLAAQQLRTTVQTALSAEDSPGLNKELS